ncbi:hypothetical protein J6590_062276 [Homalodisca vitripennis]|nr:hypothetical protein J6590_062276 [Homalodisca vitripennis]
MAPKISGQERRDSQDCVRQTLGDVHLTNDDVGLQLPTSARYPLNRNHGVACLVIAHLKALVLDHALVQVLLLILLIRTVSPVQCIQEWRQPLVTPGEVAPSSRLPTVSVWSWTTYRPRAYQQIRRPENRGTGYAVFHVCISSARGPLELCQGSGRQALPEAVPPSLPLFTEQISAMPDFYFFIGQPSRDCDRGQTLPWVVVARHSHSAASFGSPVVFVHLSAT